MNELTVKCRVCWETKEAKLSVLVTTKWEKESSKTIKDIILLCVPWMSISDDCYLCKPCLWQLKFTYDFIQRCLKTENILNRGKNMKKLNLENIFENTLKKGNKIQIIFENPASLQTDGSKNTKESAEDTDVFDGGNDEQIDQTVEISDDDSENLTENVTFKIPIPNSTLPSEHDYCIKEGTQINLTTNNQQNKMDVNTPAENKPCNSMPEENVIDEFNNPEKENIFTISDNSNEGGIDPLNDSTTESTVVKNNSDPPEANMLRHILTAKKRIRRNKTILTQPTIPDPQQVQLEKELKDLLDIVPIDVRFVTVRSEMSEEQQTDLVRDGINILNMSKDPNKKKRVIYLSRDLYKGYYRCIKCNLVFLSSCDYLDHSRLHKKGKIKTPGDPVYTCKTCSETFRYDRDLRVHSKEKHGLCSPHQCTKCNRRFKTAKNLKDHEYRFKDRECLYKCNRCNKKFAVYFSLVQHEEDVKDAPCCNYKKCKVCLKKFTKKDFKTHCTDVHPNYLCPECGLSFHSSEKVWAHRKSVHIRKEKTPSMCHQCGKILRTARSLQFHVESVHGKKKYICDKCPRVFSCQRYVEKHKQVHTVDRSTRRTWQCDECGQTYIKRESLKLHHKMVHLNLKPFVCAICNEGFARKDYYNRHLKYHDRYVMNTCPVCKKSFGYASRLESHLAAGHDENGIPLRTSRPATTQASRPKKKYKPKVLKCLCKICGKVMGNKASLSLHYKTHLNLRREKCDICGIIFQSPMALKNHKKRHTDPNFQFSCNICHAQKSSSRELELHMLDTHKEKKYKCNFCHEAFGRKHLLNSHEVLVHREEIDKREALYQILQEDQIFLSDEEGTSTKKGKIVQPIVDVDTVLNQLLNNKQEFKGFSSSFTGTTAAGGFVTTFEENQIPSDFSPKKNVIVVENEFRRLEDERAARHLEEENRIVYKF